MGEWWQSLTEAQGSVVAALITTAAAVVGVLIATMFLRSRVAGLQSEIDRCGQLIDEHGSKLNQLTSGLSSSLLQIEAFGSRIDDMVQSLKTSMEFSEAAAKNSLRAANQELDREERAQAEAADPDDPWSELRQSWQAIRDELEERALNQSIDGRTRASFARVDRRQYWLLVDKMAPYIAEDRVLFDRAVEIWQQFKSGKKTPNQEVLEEMCNLRTKLVRLEAVV